MTKLVYYEHDLNFWNKTCELHLVRFTLNEVFMHYSLVFPSFDTNKVIYRCVCVFQRGGAFPGHHREGGKSQTRRGAQICGAAEETVRLQILLSFAMLCNKAAKQETSKQCVWFNTNKIIYYHLRNVTIVYYIWHVHFRCLPVEWIYYSCVYPT